MIIVIGGRIELGAVTGARARAARVHAVMGPSIHGRGNCRFSKIQPPSVPINMAVASRVYGKALGAKLDIQLKHAFVILSNIVSSIKHGVVMIC
jgi:hypothetical protein